MELYDSEVVRLFKKKEPYTVEERKLLKMKIMNRIMHEFVNLQSLLTSYHKISEDEGVDYWKWNLNQIIESIDNHCLIQGIDYDSKDAKPDRYPVACLFGIGDHMPSVDSADLDMRDHLGDK